MAITASALDTRTNTGRIYPGLHRVSVDNWPDTVPTDYGSADCLGDDHAERHSAWGWLPDCAPEGGKHREPSATIRESPSVGWVLAVGLGCLAIVGTFALMA